MFPYPRKQRGQNSPRLFVLAVDAGMDKLTLYGQSLTKLLNSTRTVSFECIEMTKVKTGGTVYTFRLGLFVTIKISVGFNILISNIHFEAISLWITLKIKGLFSFTSKRHFCKHLVKYRWRVGFHTRSHAFYYHRLGKQSSRV